MMGTGLHGHRHPGGTVTTTTRVTGTKGSRFFTMSGDFLVSSRGTRYRVGMTDVPDRFAKGASMVTPLVAGQMKNSGVTDDLYNRSMAFLLGDRAIRLICGFEAPWGQEKSTTGGLLAKTTYVTSSVVTVKSRIDARIQYFTAGKNLPQGIQDLLTQRSIVSVENEKIIVVETFIPLNREVWVFGTYDGDTSIIFHNSTVQLSVSYTNPGEN